MSMFPQVGRWSEFLEVAQKGFEACLVNYPDQDFVIADMANGSSIGSDELIAVAQFFLDLKPQGRP